MKNKIIIIFLIIFGFINASGQEKHISASIPLEKAYFTTDRDIYINGETIWLSAFIFGNDSNPTELSSVLYIELLSESNNAAIQQKWRITDGKSSGFLVIPEDLPTGIYQLRVYTKYMKNFGSCYFPTNEITILNTDQILPSKDSSQNTHNQIITSEQLPEKNKKTSLIHISSSKAKYQCREEINLTLTDVEKSFQNKPLQIAVVLSGTNTFDSTYHIVEDQSSGALADIHEKLVWLPENRDLTISGTVRNKVTKNSVDSVEIYASVISDHPQLHIQKTDNEGNFIFNLMNLYGVQSIFFNVKTKNAEEIEILLHQDFSGEFCNNHLHSTINIDTSNRLLINNLLLNRQVNKVFPVYPTSVIVWESPSFFLFGKPTETIYPADFVDLDSFEEVFKEIVPFVIIRRHNNKSYFEVLDSKRNLVYNDPLIMLDQIPIFNVDALLKINPKRIEQIEVINQQYIYGETTFNGIIQIRTNTRDFAGIKMPSTSVFVDYQCITPQSRFFVREHNRSELQQSSIPDFRTTVYWNPDIEFEGKELKIHFCAPDNKSKIDVIISSITENRIDEISRFTLEIE